MNTHEVGIEALADSTRRHLFELIVQRPRPVGELVGEVSVSQPTVSQHLRVLRDAGLVSVESRGNRRIYHARPDGLAPLREYVDSLWTTVLSAFADHMEEEGDQP